MDLQRTLRVMGSRKRGCDVCLYFYLLIIYQSTIVIAPLTSRICQKLNKIALYTTGLDYPQT